MIEDAPARARRARAVPPAQPDARGGSLPADHGAHARRRSWNVALPDLASRLRAIPTVALSAPDDALLRAVLVKLFADRQLDVDESLLALSGDPDRALVCGRASAAVEALDREALRLKRPVTRALAAELLAREA